MLKVVLVGLMVSFTAVFGVVAWLSLRPAPAVVSAEAVVPAPPPPPARTAVLAWSRNVTAGTLIKPEDIGVTDLPANALPSGTRPDTVQARSEIIGAMVRRNVQAQGPLLAAEVLRPTDGGFLAAVLAPDHRAASVAVDAVSGTAGLIWPGDRVDLILTQEIGDQSMPLGRRTFGETVLKDVRVIAVDQQLAQGTSPDVGTTTQQQSNRTVTLEVLPEAAEKVAVAVRLGKVSLTVRAASVTRPAPADGDSAVAVNDPGRPAGSALAPSGRVAAAAAVPPGQGLKSPPTTWGADVSPALSARPGVAPIRPSMRVYQGGTAEKEVKFE